VSLRAIQTDSAPAAIGPYSQGIVANGFLFTAGQIALDPATGQIVAGDVVAQAERVMMNLKAVLDAARATWSDVVKATVFLHDMNDFPRVNEVYARALGTARPARSTVQVAGLPRGVLVEIDLIVALGSKS
jgi:2-iminobutanoate/2-iminopropanoate deaminase